MTINFVEKYVDPIPHKLWSNDFQPHSIDEIIGNEMIVETLKSYLKTNLLPNLIFTGPHGCGKSTIAKLITESYLGKYYKSCSMEVIGSISRGKNVVTEKTDKKKTSDKSSDGPNIVNFISRTINLPADKCKVITIYDFDCMTSEAQKALCRIIEMYSHRVRFIFICNNLNNIIEAIQSRTLIFKFNSIGLDQITEQLKAIVDANQQTTTDPNPKTDFSDDIYHSIAILSNGDLKQAINYLQVFSSCQNSDLISFYKIFNIPSITTVQQLILTCKLKNSVQAFEILNQLIQNGYNASDILDIIIKVLSYTSDLDDRQRVGLIEETVQVMCIHENCPSNTHLYRLIVRFMMRMI